MASLYTDHNLSRDIAAELVNRGHSATNAWDQGLRKAGDEHQLLVAARHGWTVITSDQDFLLLHAAWHAWAAEWQVTPLPVHPGIIIVPNQLWKWPEVANRVDQFLRTTPQLTNACYWWSSKASAGWQRVPP